MNDFDSAEAIAADAENLAREVGEESGLLSALETLASIYSKRGHHEEALSYQAEAMVLAERLVQLAVDQPGFLGVESSRDPVGFGITVSYWTDEAAIGAWKCHAEHQVAQERGHSEWYTHYQLRVARAERAHGGP